MKYVVIVFIFFSLGVYGLALYAHIESAPKPFVFDYSAPYIIERRALLVASTNDQQVLERGASKEVSSLLREKNVSRVPTSASSSIVSILATSSVATLNNPSTTVNSDNQIPQKRIIVQQAIVGLLCYGKISNNWTAWTATGNIIHPKGFILTNRHVAENAEYCEVAVPGKEVVLPSRDEIIDYNRRIGVMGWRPYKAITYYLPSQEGLSDKEKDLLDFGVMQITEINSDCETFNGCNSFPSAFPYNPVSSYHLPISTQRIPAARSGKFYLQPNSDETISFGYPSEEAAGGVLHNLSGNLGYVIGYEKGDQRFVDQDYVMLRETLYQTWGGASGSGVFYNGHIIGIVYAKLTALSQHQYVVPVYIIREYLRKEGFDWILDPNR